MNPSAVPLPHQHYDHQSCQQTSSNAKKLMHSPPHPHAHGYHRRRLASPISPLSTTYNTHTLNKTKDEILSVCDREVQWSFEMEYGRIVETYMKDSEVVLL